MIKWKKKEEVSKEELKEESMDKPEDCQVEETTKEEQLTDELKKKDREIEELTNRLLRLQADFMNYKNRVEKDKESIFAYATEDLMSQLLPILDNFERALDSVEKEDGFMKGVK